MEPKFNPSSPEYKKVEDLPQGHQAEFADVEGGFVKKEAIENKEKAERMAHVENSIRSKMDEAIEIAMAEVKIKTIEEETEKAMFAGSAEGKKYDREEIKKEIEEFKNIENLQAVELEGPNCCTPNIKMQDAAHMLIGSGKVSSGNFAMRDCSSRYFLVKDKKLFAVTEKVEDKEFFDNLLKK